MLQNANGYFAEHTIHHLKAMNIFSITLIRLFKYDKVLFLGDFNTEISEQRIEFFLCMHELCNIVKEKICFKNIGNPSCIDVLLTNNVYAFQQTKITICTGLSDCHKLVLTVLKTTVPRREPKEITCRD